MYYYLYDPCLSESKYLTLTAKIEARFADLGINGKINRLSFLKNIKGILAEEIKHGLKTVVVVGTDKTVNQALNLIADLDVVVGYVPITPNQPLAKYLGLGDPIESCNIISARIIEKIDLGMANNNFFLTSLTLPTEPLFLECDKSFFLSLIDLKTPIKICNLDTLNGHFSNPQDGLMEVIIDNKTKKLGLFRKSTGTLSKFLVKKLKITAKKSTVIKVDDARAIKTPVNVSLLPQQLKVIVGKERLF